MRDTETHILRNIHEDIEFGIPIDQILSYYRSQYSVVDINASDGVIHLRIYLSDERRWVNHDIKITPPRNGKNHHSASKAG